MNKEVEFVSEGATLRGFLFLPETRTPKPPIVIMAHGTSATVNMVVDKYAEAFYRAGMAALLYDNRNFGLSGGEPRQEINSWIQARGYRDAMNFAEKLDEIDPNPIALWGDSYTGGLVIVLGAVYERVKAIVAQCPVCGAEPPRVEPGPTNFEVIKETLLRGDVRASRSTTIEPIPVVSFDHVGTPSLLKPIQAFRWFIDYGGRPGSLWVNNVTRVIPATPMPCNPVASALFVKPPILMMVAREDQMVHANYAVARQAYDLMPRPKQCTTFQTDILDSFTSSLNGSKRLAESKPNFL